MKPVITADIKARFAAYHDANVVWGSLHIILEDGNLRDGDVRFCIEWAKEHDDAEGVALGKLLLAMSKTQRRKLMGV